MTVARMTWIEKKKAYELMTNFMVSRTSVGQFENSFFPTYSKPTLNTGLEASEQRVFSVTHTIPSLYINFTFLISERHRRGEKAPVRKREVPGSHPDNYQEIKFMYEFCVSSFSQPHDPYAVQINSLIHVIPPHSRTKPH